MRISSKSPKVFSVFVEDENNKMKFIRFRSSMSLDGNISYTCTLVDKMKDASKYVNFDSVKTEARKIKDRFKLENVGVLDDKTGKTFHIH